MELNDELSGWQAYLTMPAPPVEKLVTQGKSVISAWLAAAFSEVSDTVLHRYFRYHRQKLRVLLEPLAGDARFEPVANELNYLSGFLEGYFGDFLTEVPQQSREPNQAGKLAVSLSVAQLACLLRLLYEQGGCPAASIAELIRFTAAHFHSKRQEQISTGSLSKEYYGTSQATAASCLELLERLVKQLKQNFFP